MATKIKWHPFAKQEDYEPVENPSLRIIKRGPVYYIRCSIAGKKRKVSTGTDGLQVAKEKLRQFESAQAQGVDSPLPSKTPIASVLTAYVTHIRAIKTAKSAQTDIYYLRDAFGPVITSSRSAYAMISTTASSSPLSVRGTNRMHSWVDVWGGVMGG